MIFCVWSLSSIDQFCLIITSACSQLWVAMALILARSVWSFRSPALHWFSHSASVTPLQILSREPLSGSAWLAAHIWSSQQWPDQGAREGPVGTFLQVSKRVGSSQGPSRSRWGTKIGESGEDFNKNGIYKGLGRVEETTRETGSVSLS